MQTYQKTLSPHLNIVVSTIECKFCKAKFELLGDFSDLSVMIERLAT